MYLYVFPAFPPEVHPSGSVWCVCSKLAAEMAAHQAVLPFSFFFVFGILWSRRIFLEILKNKYFLGWANRRFGQKSRRGRGRGVEMQARLMFLRFWKVDVFYIQTVQDIRRIGTNRTRVAWCTNSGIGAPQEPVTSSLRQLKSGYIALTVSCEKHPSVAGASTARTVQAFCTRVSQYP